MSNVSCFNSSSSALSHTLPRMIPVTSVHRAQPAPVHIRTSLPSQSQWYMWLFIVHFVYELLHCLWTHWGTFLQSVFMNSCNQGLIGIVVSPWLSAVHSRLFSDWWLPPLTALHQLHHQPSSPLHWPTDTFWGLCVIYCWYFSLFTRQEVQCKYSGGIV